MIAGITLALTATLVAGCSDSAQQENPKKIDYSVVPQVIAVIGDFGVGNSNEAKVAKMVHSYNPSLILTVGDNAYYRSGYERLVGRYYDEDLVAATGNHDYLMGIKAWDQYFTPDVPSRDFVYRAASNVDFFVLDSQAGLDSRSKRVSQKRWLLRQLAISDRKFKVVLFHHPSFSSSKHGSTPRYQWDFAAMGADLVINGHDHTYERIRRGKMTYVVDGTGGAKLYKCKPNRVYGSKKCIDDYFGAVFLYVNDQGLRGVYRTSAGVTLDTFTIEK